MSEEMFYNPEIKTEYLETIENESTRKLTEYPFKKAKETEKLLGKDIYEMNINELGDVLQALSSSTTNAAYVNAVRFEHYINWAIEKGLVSNMSPFDEVDKRVWSSQFVAVYREVGVTREELFMDMINPLENEVDQALLLALFEGISGEGYAELLNLTSKDLHEKDNDVYTVTLYTKSGSEREIRISRELFKLLHQADQQEEYRSDSDDPRAGRSEFADSPYVFKKTKRGKQTGELSSAFVNRKFNFYKERFGLKFLRPKHIINSGIMHMANELYQQHGELNKDHIELIAQQFVSELPTDPIEKNGKYNTIKNILRNKLFEDKYGYKVLT